MEFRCAIFPGIPDAVSKKISLYTGLVHGAIEICRSPFHIDDLYFPGGGRHGLPPDDLYFPEREDQDE